MLTLYAFCGRYGFRKYVTVLSYNQYDFSMEKKKVKSEKDAESGKIHREIRTTCRKINYVMKCPDSNFILIGKILNCSFKKGEKINCSFMNPYLLTAVHKD